MKKLLIRIIVICLLFFTACAKKNDTQHNTTITTTSNQVSLNPTEDGTNEVVEDPVEDDPNKEAIEDHGEEDPDEEAVEDLGVEDPNKDVVEDPNEIEPTEPVVKDTSSNTQIVISSTGKELKLPIPKQTNVAVNNTTGITLDQKELESLANLMNSFQVNVSVYYIDILTGTTIEARGDIKYAAASVIKAPVVKAILETNPDLDEEIELIENHILRGSGTIKKQPLGTKFSVRDLIKYTIEESDNTAYKMLCMRYGFDQFDRNANKLGIKSDQATNLLFGSLSSRDTALYFQDIYHYGVNGNENGQLLIENLINASFSELAKKALPNKEVAEKYGLVTDNLLYHTGAIVYGDRPYVIAVLSNLDETKGGAESIREIITHIDRIHNSIE